MELSECCVMVLFDIQGRNRSSIDTKGLQLARALGSAFEAWNVAAAAAAAVGVLGS